MKQQKQYPRLPNASRCIKNINDAVLSIPTVNSKCKAYEIKVPNNGPIIHISIHTNSIIRVQVFFTAAQSTIVYPYILSSIPEPLFNIEMSESDDSFKFFTSQLKGIISKQPFGLTILNMKDHVIYKDVHGKAFKRDLQSRVYHYFELSFESFIYGLGQNQPPLNKVKQYIRQSPTDSLGHHSKTLTMYKHMPFYIRVDPQNLAVTGVYYNNTYDCVIDMGNSRSGYWPEYGYYCADGGDIDYFVISGEGIDDVVKKYTDLVGKSVMMPICAFGYLGSTMYYAQLEKNCDQQILGFVKKCLKYGIPVSNFHLSSGYTTSNIKKTSKRYTLTWNSDKFPSPKRFFENMAQFGVTVSPNVKPGMLLSHPLYKQFSQLQSFILDPDADVPYIDRWWGGDGSFVDFTNPGSRQIWKFYLKERLLKMGTTSIWNDNNEYQSLSDKSVRCSVEQNQGIFDQYRNIQSLLMARSAYQAIQQLNPTLRPYLISRSGCTGIQKYASSWSGDNFTSWVTLRDNLSTILNVGLCGLTNYGCDIGGFWGNSPGPELLLRWVQNGIFQARFSIHSCNQDNTVTEPWMYSQYTAEIARTIRLRYAFLPYLYTLSYESHVSGVPICRPLVYQFLEDIANCGEIYHSFMLGSFLLVSTVLHPILELPLANNSNETIGFPNIHRFLSNCITNFIKLQQKKQSFNVQCGQHMVYFPKGSNWFSWSGPKTYKGGSTVNFNVNQSSIPVFLRDPSIVPLAFRFGNGQSVQQLNTQKYTGIYLKIAYTPSAHSCSTLIFQDDGVSVIYQSPPSYCLTNVTVSCADNAGKWNKDIVMIGIRHKGNIQMNVSQETIIQLRSGDKRPIWISVNGIQCEYEQDHQKWEQWTSNGVGCWTFDNDCWLSLLKLSPHLSRINCDIQICYDKLIEFSKQYSQI